MSEKSPPHDDIKQISDRLLSKHNERLNRDFAAIFGRSRVEHKPILSNSSDWLKDNETQRKR